MTVKQIHRRRLLLLLLSVVVNCNSFAGGFQLVPFTQPAARHGHSLTSRTNFENRDWTLPSMHMSKNKNNNNDDDDDDDDNDRSQGLRQALLTVGEDVDSTDNCVRVGSTVVAGTNIPNLGIWQYQSYTLTSIYDQGVNNETGLVEKRALPFLVLDNHDETTTISQQQQQQQQASSPAGYTRYVTLYAEKHHGKDASNPNCNQKMGVVVSPREVQLSSLQQEVVDSILWALPLFGFWTALAFSFANQYSERTGGTFLDAMLGR